MKNGELPGVDFLTMLYVYLLDFNNTCTSDSFYRDQSFGPLLINDDLKAEYWPRFVAWCGDWGRRCVRRCEGWWRVFVLWCRAMRDGSVAQGDLEMHDFDFFKRRD